jgi:hypothetical protein
MAVPTLKLNLAPPSSLWRLHHAALGWAAIVAGGLILAASAGFTLRAYRQASQAGQLAVARNAQTRMTEDSQRQVLDELRSVDVAKEMPRWRLAERIYTERSLPWSRLTAELERSLVQDVRLKALQRTRGSDMKVQVKIKGEARTRDAEAAFVESLQKNAFFEQVILEREGERQGGGVEFEYTLAASPLPPFYQALPKFGPTAKAGKTQAAPAPTRPGTAVPRVAPAAPAPAPVRPAQPAQVPQVNPEGASRLAPPGLRPPRGRHRPTNSGGEE